MNNDLVARPDQELESFKKPATLDEVFSRKIRPVLDAVNNHVEQIYADFNTAMLEQIRLRDVFEQEITRMTQVLWGIVNDSNARMAALEQVLIKGGMSPDEVNNELKDIRKKLTEGGEWQELSLQKVAKSIAQANGQEAGSVPPPPQDNGQPV